LFCGAALILLAMLLTIDAEPALDPRPQVFFQRCRTVTARPWEPSLLGFATSTRGFIVPADRHPAANCMNRFGSPSEKPMLARICK
jgi:hypothetical protein